ncbi:MAG: hypothetical protein HQL37_15800, partial [Alphaproteobacteria bacterium]|nr:hypothetical protein [Alphaproteobacteria bacterium]
MADPGALSVGVDLTVYPPELDNAHGDHLAFVLSEVASERVRQDRKWGGPKHDDG